MYASSLKSSPTFTPPPHPNPHPTTPPTAAAVRLQPAGSAIYIGNLPWHATDIDVEEAASVAGTVMNVTFLEEAANGKSQGAALVEYREKDAAVRARDRLNDRCGWVGWVGRYGCAWGWWWVVHDVCHMSPSMATLVIMIAVFTSFVIRVIGCSRVVWWWLH